MTAENKTAQQCIESICEQGCSVVREVIGRLEHGEDVNEVSHLSGNEKEQVLKELRDIMDVYDKP